MRFKEILEGAVLVYFDGRLTEAAIPLAEAARAAGGCALRLPNQSCSLALSDDSAPLLASNFPLWWSWSERQGLHT